MLGNLALVPLYNAPLEGNLEHIFSLHFIISHYIHIFPADGVVWYSMPQGEKRGADINLMDVTYDGHRPDDNGILTGGLGQLTDGVEGSSNFRLDPLGLGIKGK